ncbi:uncharacterized protein A4U43_C01F25820 [Asparagus officinalis]|uniref:Glycosyltransferase subfamily 4-like N-terminal domain-containing protein n=2 Tax=Asparagus officinalis TaxID=4686 RepID=A0A5P1FW84_ASPOF|nr:uncharacterized protein A4U43_C01F25820 [Asparagus officinalis]
MAPNCANSWPRKSPSNPFLNHLRTILFALLVFSLGALLLTFPTTSSSLFHTSLTSKHFSGDLRNVKFSWNLLTFSSDRPPPTSLKIAVFSRKWPAASAPGGMERHALTLHTALARRGHRIHVFTSAPPPNEAVPTSTGHPKLHFLEGPPGQWRCEDAWALFEAENLVEPFDVVHSESVALHHRFASRLPNLVVSWHGIALEVLHSNIYQDYLIRELDEPTSPSFNNSLSSSMFKVLSEIRFFKNYTHHIAVSDSMGEMLRDMYQIPKGRVHVILNGVDEDEFGPDKNLGAKFRSEIGVPNNAAVVMGVAGRLVKDKGHPLLFGAFSKLITRYPKVYLVVAGTGPWAQRYTDLGPNVIALGALPPSKLKAFYNSIDIFVNPTLRPQGLDLTLMEAMQCATPIMATRLPSIKQSIIIEEDFGFMFAPNLEELIE